MIGQLGNDSLASLLLTSLKSAGASTDLVGKSDCSTGAAVILVLPDGENVIVISPGANATVTPRVGDGEIEHPPRGLLLAVPARDSN